MPIFKFRIKYRKHSEGQLSVICTFNNLKNVSFTNLSYQIKIINFIRNTQTDNYILLSSFVIRQFFEIHLYTQ